MQQEVPIQSQAIQPRQRLSDPIRINAEILHQTLQAYEEKLGAFKLTLGMASEAMERLSLLCERLKKTQQSDGAIQYLQPEELFELANILFDGQTEQDNLTSQIIVYLKHVTRFNQIESAYNLAKKEQQLNIQLFQVLYNYPMYAEKSVALSCKYPDVVGVFSLLNEQNIINEDIYLAICVNAQYVDEISRIFAILKDSPMYGDRRLYLAVCENAQFADEISRIFAILKDRLLQDDREISLAICENAHNADAIFNAFSDLNNSPLQKDREIYLALSKNAQYAKALSMAFRYLNSNDLHEDSEIYLAVWTNGQYAKNVSRAFRHLNSSPLREDREIYLAVCENAQYADGISDAFSTLKNSPLREDREIYLAVCKNAQYADKIFSAFWHLNDSSMRVCQEIYLAICENARYADGISDAFSTLKDSPLQEDRKAYLAICANAQFAYAIALAFSTLNNSPMQKDQEIYLAICENARYADGISDAFSILKDSPVCEYREAYLAIGANEQLKSVHEDFIRDKIGPFRGKYREDRLAIILSKHYAEGISDAFSALKDSPVCEDREAYLAICANAIVAEEIFDAFSTLNDSPMQKDRKIYLAFCANAQYAQEMTSAFFTLQNSPLREDREVYFAICANAQYSWGLGIGRAFNTLNNSPMQKDQEIYLAVCKNAKNAFDISRAFSDLNNSPLRMSREIYLLVCEKSKNGNAQQIAQAFVAFHQTGYLNQTLIDLICEHAEYAKDIAELFVCLKPTGLLSHSEKYQKPLFIYGRYAKDLKPLFELMIKADMFRCDEWYDIVLARKIPANAKNIIILDQETKALYHFDENGNETKLLEEQALKTLKLNYLFTKEIEEGEIEDFSHELNDKTRLKINNIIQSRGCKISSDHRELNFEMVCRNAKYAKNILPLLRRLDGVGLLFQSIVALAFEKAQYIQPMNEIFCHLNRLDTLNKSNCEKVFQKSQYAERLLTAIESLYAAGLNREGLYQKEIVQLICEYPEYAQNIVSIASCLKQVNIMLDDNLIAIARNVKYSAGILAACHALFLGHSLTQYSLNLIFADPKQAIFIAFENGGIGEKGNDGLEDFEHTQKVCKVFRETGAGLFFGKAQSEKLLVESPGDEDAEEREAAVKFEDLTMFCLLPEAVLHNIASKSGNNTLDKETREEVISNTLNCGM